VQVNLDANSLIASLVVSSIGLVLFLYGKKMGRWPQIATGLVLIIYPYFIPGVRLMLGVAGVLLALFWISLRLGW
jgi:hypothetical protein